MATKSPIDPELVREMAQLINETDLTEIEVQKGDLRIRVARTITATVMAPVAASPAFAAPPVAAAAAPVEAKSAAAHPGTVPSPMVGTAYRRASPDAKPFVEVGSAVKEGDRICLIEAMKTFNDIVAPRSGTVTRILFDDGRPVEYGEPLMIIE